MDSRIMVLIMALTTFFAYPYLSGSERKQVAPLAPQINEQEEEADDEPEPEDEDEPVMMDDEDLEIADLQLGKETQAIRKTASDAQIMAENQQIKDAASDPELSHEDLEDEG